MSDQGDVLDGRFELLERLGSGGMGTVWRARDTVLHREVALKEVRPPGPESTGDASRVLRERVLREARALARVNHPHVVTIHHIVDMEPHPWLVMELLPGRTLQDLLEQRTLPPREAARLGRELLSALRAAHAAGVLHRDIKPANVLLREPSPDRPDGVPPAVLTDFGIAAVQGSTQLTATGDLIGSPEYIAPERVRGTGEGPAADLWSLGLVLYVAVEGVSPLRRATTLATLAAVLDEPVPPPVRSGPLAPALEALLVRDPQRRPDAARLDAMLAAVADGIEWQPTETAARPVPPPPPLAQTPPVPTAYAGPAHPEPRRRTPVVVAAVSVVLALVATAALVLALRDGSGQDGKAGGETTTGAGPSASRTPTKTASKAPSATAATSPTRSAPPSRSTPPASATPAPPPASGRWIAQLHSEPGTSSAATRDRRLAAVRKQIPEAQYLRSDDYASLRPGFWVFYAPGPFADGRAALRFCAERGRTSGNSCVGRYLSDNGGDYALQCKPPVSSPAGRCTRP
ncbi:serine/threonine-protein kinase [Streptomyces aurantiacus]|uniref:non-specific serine/threonine protein kinase n=1 Tax=Streptomyces aurantiacus JA 4570 TaxID=1286094 RepID=S3ZCH6_9ACTN|nr:serine/threonine-protein kinase [Streptomyces aurantiacus]EPH41401.1 putative Serine/threonine-protein kinase PAK 6 [Streptomyces aurantiacus JA 4570]